MLPSGFGGRFSGAACDGRSRSQWRDRAGLSPDFPLSLPQRETTGLEREAVYIDRTRRGRDDDGAALTGGGAESRSKMLHPWRSLRGISQAGS
jgi:hypothetical protein